MTSHTRHSFLALVCALAAPAVAQTISSPYDLDYTYVDLGSITGVPPNLGGLTFLAGDDDTLLIGGSANGGAGAIYSVPVTRDAMGHITGFGAATQFSTAPYIDGGLTYGPGGVLFATGYSVNNLLQIKAGSTAPDSTTNLTSFGISGSVGTCLFVPPGWPGAGEFKVASYSGQTWHTVDLTANAQGTYDVTAASPGIVIGGGPEGILYPPPGSPQLPDFTTVIVAEYGTGSIVVYDIDANGDPIPATRRTLMTGLSGAEGAVVDPVTGDMVFSTFGGGNRVVRITGFAACGFYQTYGQGCGGALGVPQISGGGCPVPGATISIDIDNAPANAFGQLCLGDATLNAPIFNCTVLILIDACIGITSDATGAFNFTIDIPNQMSFNDWHGYWQAAFLDPTAPSGVVLTGGLDMFVN